MENNLNYDKISFDNSSYNEQDINLTDSYNYNISDIQSIQNYNYASNQINIFEQQLYEYERNNFRKKNNQQFHFDFKGELLHDTNGTENENNNIIKTSNMNIIKDNYPKDFFTNINIEKRCRIFTNSKYIVFENNYGENSCYLNVLLHFLYNSNDIRSYLINLYQSSKPNQEKETEIKEDDGNRTVIISKKDRKGNKNANAGTSLEPPKSEDKKINLTKEDENKAKMDLLALLGNILWEYKDALENSDKKVNLLRTIKFREYLNVISKGKFPLNKAADQSNY